MKPYHILISEMDQEKMMKNYCLFGAVDNDDIEATLQLLDQGADPNYKPQACPSVINLAFQKNNVNIITMLMRYGFKSENAHFAKEVSDLIINHDNGTKIMQKIFGKLLRHEEPETVKVLEFLFDNGMPIDDLVEEIDDRDEEDILTPLQLSIETERLDFVRLSLVLSFKNATLNYLIV